VRLQVLNAGHSQSIEWIVLEQLVYQVLSFRIEMGRETYSSIHYVVINLTWLF
jgi:hypothetical protein